MEATKGMTKKLATGALGVVAAAGLGGAVWAVTSGPASSGGQVPAALSTTASTVAPSTGTAGPSARSGARGRAGARGLLGRTDHATAEVRVQGQWVTYDLDRGTVTSVSPTAITLLRPDGQSVTFTINSSTKYGRSQSEATMATGRPAAVISKDGVAVRVRQGTGPASAGSAGQASTGSAASSVS
jgi:hypothetical protein